MTTLPLTENNTYHCVWSRQSAEMTVLEAVLLYSEVPYRDTNAASAPANWLIFVFPYLMGKAVTFRAWKNLFAHPWSRYQNREQQSASTIPVVFFFARGFLDCGWITQRITSMIPCSLVAAVGENYQGAATFAPNLCRERFIHCPLMLCLSKIPFSGHSCITCHLPLWYN